MISHFKRTFYFRFVAWAVILAFSTTLLEPCPRVWAQSQSITPINLSQPFAAPFLRGMTLYPQNPFRFDFIVDGGNSDLNEDELKGEGQKLIQYFLASLTIPETDLWVNLSPHEKDRIVPDELGHTAMGRDLLAQDYILKQLTASLTSPQNDLGQKFWDAVYQKAKDIYGTTDIPFETFSRVWIVPEKAVVYEKGTTAVVVKTKLKVMLADDYENQRRSLAKGGLEGDYESGQWIRNLRYKT